jgi:hypothetical protein
MSETSEYVNLGINPENSSTNQGMVKILEQLHLFIDKPQERTVLGGDQLTDERASSVYLFHHSPKIKITLLLYYCTPLPISPIPLPISAIPLPHLFAVSIYYHQDLIDYNISVGS